MFGSREYRGNNVAGMTMRATRVVIDVTELQIARGGAVDKCSHVWRRFRPSTDDSGSPRIRHLCREVASHQAWLPEEATDQYAQSVYYANFGGVHGFR